MITLKTSASRIASEGVNVIKAVFFDWFNTLARYEPPEEELKKLQKQKLILALPTNLTYDVNPIRRKRYNWS